MPFDNSTDSLKKPTTIALAFIIIASLLLVLIQAKPFGVDEWRLIYNIKFKNAGALWAHLDFVQQFPRLYLELIKLFSSAFDYSYFTLRLPSFLTGTAAIIVCYRLMHKIFTPDIRTRYLFVLILATSHAFLEHFIEVKQYTMDILLSLVAIWQFIELFYYIGGYLKKSRYFLLCLSFLIIPFFSYTYPIVIAPVYIIVLLQSINQVIVARGIAHTKTYLLQKWIPLTIGIISIIIFYYTDVSRVMADKDMHTYWASQMMQQGFDTKMFLTNFFLFFAQIGSGDLLEAVFGILGISAFILGIFHCIKRFDYSLFAFIKLYCVLLLSLTLALFVAGKLPLGVPRLNAFTIAAIAILIVNLIHTLSQSFQLSKFVTALPVILFICLTGNIINTYALSFIKNNYSTKLDIYVNTENAIIQAQTQQLPILITPHVAFPCDKVLNFPNDPNLGVNMCFPSGYDPSAHCISNDDIPGDWVLKTFPAYKPQYHLPVYAIKDLNKLNDCIKLLPPTIKTFLVGDGISFKIVSR